MRWYPTPQPKALSMPSSVSTPRVALPSSKHCRIHGSRELDPRRRWCSAIREGRACRGSRNVMARTTKKRTSRHLALAMKMKAGARSGSPSCRATPQPGTRRQQQYLSPSSPDDRAPRGQLVGLVAKGAPKSTASPQMSFPDALNNAKAASETESTRERPPHAPTIPTASQPRRMEEEVDEVKLRMPGSVDLGITATVWYWCDM